MNRSPISDAEKRRLASIKAGVSKLTGEKRADTGLRRFSWQSEPEGR